MKKSLQLLTILLTCFALSACNSGFSIHLTADEIQSQLGSAFPVTKKKLIFTTTLSNPKILLAKGSDRVGMAVDVAVSTLGVSATGTASLDGQLDYDPSTGEVFFNQPKLQELKIDGLNDTLLTRASELVSLISSTTLKRLPVYRLDENDFGQSLAKSMLKSVKVVDGEVEIGIGVNDS